MKLKASLLSLAVTVAFAFNASAHDRCCSHQHKSCAPRHTACAQHSCDTHRACEGRNNTCAHHSCEAHEEYSCHRHTAQWNWRHCTQDHKNSGHHSHDKDNSRDDA